MTLRAEAGVSDRGRRYVMKRQRVLMRGTVIPFVPGQRAVIEVRRRGRRVTRLSVPIRRAGRRGRFSARFTVRSTGAYIVRARHGRTAGQARFAAPRVVVRALDPQAGLGSSGLKVRLLQRGLRSLGYVSGGGGHFDGGTARAVLAFRKANRMARTGFAGRALYRKLFRRAGRFRLRHPKAGKHVEFDWSRQLLVLARGGRALRVYHASSGKASTPTVFGSYRFYRRYWGTNSHGMVHSSYFVGGYAIHGYPSVPSFPASHGCIRVPIPNALAIARWIKLGDPVLVYR